MIGKTISHYKILEKIGEGGMGIVYKALDTKLNRTVALKFLAPHLLSDSEEKQRFFVEAEAAAALDHPNICTVYEIDESEGEIFIAMAYLEGESLRKKLKSGLLSLEEDLDIGIQAALGLQEAHEKGIIHRDVKSDNITVTTKGQAKIMDFGLAKLTRSKSVTKKGVTVGTVAYMSPEQAQGGEMDHRSDIWSLGVVLYEMMTGELPFKGEYDQAVIYSILNENPSSITTIRKDLPAELERITTKCLQKNATQRYQTAFELVADLKRVQYQLGFRETTYQFQKHFTKHIFLNYLRKFSVPLVGIFLIVLLTFLFPPSQRAIKRWFGIPPIPLQKHLVVLPFTNIGGDPKNQAFCDGLVETLNSKLSQLEQFQGTLRVVPSSEVRKFKVTNTEEARKILGIPMALTGSVQVTKDSMRFTLSLIDTKTLKKIKSTVDAYPMANLANMQNQALRKIAQMLKIELQPKAQKMLGEGTTSVSRAYVLYLQGRGYLISYEKKENLDLAIGLFNKALEEDSFYILAYVSLAETYWRKYEVSKDPQWIEPATKICTQALQLNQKLPTAHLALGIIHKGNGRYTEAVDEFQKALELDSVSLEAYVGLAEAYEALGESDKAEFTYQKAVKVRPSYWRGYNYLAVFYYSHGRYQDAVRQFQQVIALTPENIRGYNNLGGVFTSLRLWEDAREMFKRSLDIRPNYVAYHSLGNLYYFQEARHPDAARMYQKALELDSSDYRVWGSLGSAYYWTPGQREKAKAVYQRAIQMAEEKRQLNPQNATLLSHLADFYSMLEEEKKALPLLEQSLRLAPDDAEVLARAAETYEQLGQREKALDWIEKALKKGYELERIVRSPGLRQLLSDYRFQGLIKELSEKPQK